MDSDTRDKLTARATWTRFLYMVLFVAVFHVAAGVAGLVMVVQFALTLITGESNAELRQLGGRIGRYLAEIVSFLTFAGDERPYPFKPWPGAAGAPSGSASASGH